jgi:glucose-1-phosphate thymidylyltransferase
MSRIILFEDHFVDDLRPIALTRPAFGITIAAWNLFDVAERAADGLSYVVRDYIAGVAKRSFPASPAKSSPILFLNASVAPDVRYVEALQRLLKEGKPRLFTAGQRVAAAVLPAGVEPPEDLTPKKTPPWLLGLGLPLESGEPFEMLNYPFDVVRHLQPLFPANLQARLDGGEYHEVAPGVYAGKDVRIAPSAVFNTENGPVVLSEGVEVMDFTYFRGPVYVGPRSRITERSSVKDFVSIGHTCKIGGEIEASVIEAYSNKQHHGFLGHSYVGSWVNLGAGTSNSDLKNTYGEIRVEYDGRRLDTGMQFFGCVIGDFAKSAINTSIFTGKSVGVASMLYGYVGQNVPCFCNYAKLFGQVTEVGLEQAITTQKRMFERRGVEQTDNDVALLTAVYELTRHERRLSNELPAL